jgi:hypothetical protein
LPESPCLSSVSASRHTVTFNPENRLTGIAGASYGYDPDGLRASKAAGGTTTYFVYDGDTPVLEEGSSGQVVAANGMAADGWRARYYTGAVPGGAVDALVPQLMI